MLKFRRLGHHTCSKFIVTGYNDVFNNTTHSEVAMYVGSPWI